MLKAAIIGLGVGEAHIAGYNSHPNCKVVALCDFDPDKVKMAKQKYPGLKITTEADEILEDKRIDVVSVASYDNYHHKQILKAIEFNKHVFVEKPMCIFDWEAKEIRKALNQKPHIRMSSNLILRSSPRFILLRQMIKEGILGSLYYMEADYNYGRLNKLTEGWRGKIPFYSVVHGGLVHMVDLLLWLTGEKVSEVSAFGNNISTKDTQYKYNDLVCSILRFENGVNAKVTANFGCVFPHFHQLSVYGTKATFVNGIEDGLLYKSRESQANPVKITTPYQYKAKGDMIPDFIQGILEDKPLLVDKEDVFRTMSICFAIEQASTSNSKVKVNYL
jgi:predicted dehydrogenase